MLVRKTTRAERNRVNALFAVAFEQPMENGPAEEAFSGCHWAAFEPETGEMMSTLTVTDFQIQFDGHPCKMGGIGGVATLPAYRRRGGIREIFREALPDMYRNGFDFSYLYPFSTGYYRKFGYENCVRKLAVTLDLGLLKARRTEGKLAMAEPGHDLSAAVRTIETAWERQYNMMVLHRAEDAEWAAQAQPAVKQQFCYVYFAPDGTPKAYTRFRLELQSDGRNLVCDRFFFLDREGFDGLMGLFQSMASDHRYVKFQLPADPAMAYLMPEWSLGAAGWTVAPAGMVRVVNVQSVLEKAKYLGSGEAAMEITDPQIPENTGVFHVVFRDGQAVTVEKTTEAPEVSMPISAFSALLSGVCAWEQAAAWMPEVTVHKNDPALAGVFYRKPLFLADYF